MINNDVKKYFVNYARELNLDDEVGHKIAAKVLSEFKLSRFRALNNEKEKKL